MKKEMLNGVNDVIIDNDSMWMISDYYPCLFRYDFLNKELELTAMFPETMESGNFAFSKIAKVENEIYFIPRLAKDIYYYNIIKKEFGKLNISFDGFRDNKFMEVVIQENYLYCINRFPDVVIKIDSITKEVNMFHCDMKPRISIEIENWVNGAFQSPCIYQGKIIWPNYKNVLTVFDTKKECFSIVTLEGLSHETIEKLQDVNVEDYIVGVRAYENVFWLFSFEGKIYQYDNEIRRIECKLFDNYMRYENTDNSKWFILYDIVSLKKGLIFIPSYKNKCIGYNSHTKQYEEVLDDYVQNWEGNRRIYTFCKKISDHEIILYSYYESCFYILNMEKNSVYKLKIKIPYIKFVKENPQFERMLLKDNVYNFDELDYLLERIQLDDKGEQNVMPINNIIGKQIYEAIK